MTIFLFNFAPLFLVALAVFVLLRLPGKELSFVHKFCRERNLATAVLAVVAAVSLYFGLPILKGDFPTVASILPFAAPVFIILSYLYLDFLLVRTYGAAYLVLLIFVLDANFDAALSYRGFAAIFYYAFALLAVFMVAQPWRVRDFAEKVAQQELTIKKMAFPALSMALLAFIPTVLFYV